MAGFEIVSEVSTRETDFDGTRHDAWSDWTSNTAPADHVINHNEVKIEWLSDHGSVRSPILQGALMKCNAPCFCFNQSNLFRAASGRL